VTKRLAAAQIHFRSGITRSYLFAYQQAGTHRKGGLIGKPLSFTDASIPGKLDLRQPDHVARLQRVLERMPLTGLA
jgi:hypothetical protein